MDRDLELMQAVGRGDAESFDALLARHRTPLVNFFSRMVRDYALAEDLAQEVFLRVYKARERWKPDAKFTTWLYRIATNLALNALRDSKRTVSAAVADDGDGEDAAARLAAPAPRRRHPAQRPSATSPPPTRSVDRS